MTTNIYFPPVNYLKHLELGGAKAISELASIAGIALRATGPWTERKVDITLGPELRIEAEPGDWGAVRITQTEKLTEVQQARLALIVLAYGLYDLVAKETIRGASWSRPTPPRGRPRRGRPQSSRERQRAFRARQRTSH